MILSALRGKGFDHRMVPADSEAVWNCLRWFSLVDLGRLSRHAGTMPRAIRVGFPAFHAALSALMLLSAWPLLGRESSPRLEQPFDAGWLFHRGDLPGAEDAAFNDAGWRVLDVPHDWSIEDLPSATNSLPSLGGTPVGPFSLDSPGGASTGYVVGGTGWYRKHFALGAANAGQLVSVLFDGVYMDADVWLNGQHLGNHPYGYTPFAFDLTSKLRPTGETNVLAVRVRNLGKNSRWYSGSGIYRHVRLTVTGPLRVPLWGVTVTTPQVAKDRATVKVVTTVKSSLGHEAVTSLRMRLFGPNGKAVKSAEAQARVSTAGQTDIPQSLEVRSPALWSPDKPQLYRVEVEVLVGGQVVDRTGTAFGIREIRFSAENGFTINGEPLALKGGCVHHDNGALGAAAIDRAEERRVELMKASGFNAIRTSHNPPSAAFLDACDRLGVLVIDEAFDCWETGKNPDDYHRFFED